MRKVSLIAALVLGGLVACTTVATAQQQQGKERKGRAGFSAEQQLERMNTQLSLTDAQKPKVKAVLEETSKKRQELFSDTSVAREERATKMRDLQDAQDKKLKAILTPEQYKKWEEARTEMRKKRGQGQGGGRKKAE